MPSLTETRAHLHSEATRSPLVCGYQQLRVCVVSIWRCTPVPIREFIASLWMCAPLAESASLLHIWVYNIIMKSTWYITLQNLKKLPISVQFWTKALNRAPCYSWDTWMCMKRFYKPSRAIGYLITAVWTSHQPTSPWRCWWCWSSLCTWLAWGSPWKGPFNAY